MSNTAAAMKTAMLSGSLQPVCATWMNPYTVATMPATESAAPTKSKRPSRRSDWCKNMNAPMMSPIPIGTLTNSTQRQLR